MKRNFHINVGHRYAKPFESFYSITRRCLSANPGIPFSVIENELRSRFPKTFNFYDRINKLQLVPKENIRLIEFRSPRSVVYYSYKRQCPCCAKQGYHSDVFGIPALKKCPIHNEDLVKICPSCNSPWPSNNEIPTRKCKVCGIIPFDILSACINKNKYKPISEVTNLFNQKRTRYENYFFELTMLYKRYYGNNWWSNISKDSPYYPAYLMYTSNLTENKLEKLGVRYTPLHRISSPLIKISRDEVLDTLSNKFVMSKLDKSLLREDYNVMKSILEAFSLSSHSHEFNLCDYNSLHSIDHTSDPPVCVHCASLSLWFFQTAFRKHGIHDSIKYPYSQFGASTISYSISIPFVIKDGCEYFLPNTKFRKWFYQYGLEVLFASIFYHVCKSNRCRRLSSYKENPIAAYYSDKECNSKQHVLIDEFYGDKITVYHNENNPIEKEVSAYKYKGDQSKLCSKYERYMKKFLLPSKPFFEKVNSKSFEYKDFKQIHKKLRMHIKEFY